METVLIVWSLSAAAAMVLAVLCGLMWLLDRRDTASLMLGILGLATAISAYIELGIMQSTTPQAFGAWVRWYHLAIFPALIAQALFVHHYLGHGIRWLLWSFLLARTFVFVVNFLVQPNYHFVSIDSLRFVSLLGDRVAAIGEAVPRTGLQSIALASLVLLFAYVVTAVVRCWRKGGVEDRRKAMAVGVAEVAPMLCTIVYGQLVFFGVFQAPLSNIPWFLGALLIMAYVSGRDFMLGRRARLEVAELRSQLAQIERVNLLGQLASGLAHELSQPMTAISLNVAAARKHLGRADPDLAEVREIVEDVTKDHGRAVEIINGMRRLFKQHTIEPKPVRIEDVVQNAVALVRAEANAKGVDLRWQIEPGLPPVYGDAVPLSQVLLNLLVNSIQAVQARPAGARLVVIEGRAGSDGEEVEICVQDSGPGIPGTIVHRIFDPLFTTKPDGMGMGLALSRAIIEAHGGRLWADRADRADGAAFHFTLRRA